jgi:hypothetical protein
MGRVVDADLCRARGEGDGERDAVRDVALAETSSGRGKKKDMGFQ